MTERQLPESIAPFKLARQGRNLQGHIPLASMPRLLPSLENDKGRVNIDVSFGFDEAGVALMRGNATAELELRCQRCMEAMSFSLDLIIEVAFAMSDEHARQISKDYEPCVLNDDQVALSELIEDELILSLPIVPMHDDENCQQWLAENRAQAAVEPEEDPGKKNPFAVLADLKRK